MDRGYILTVMSLQSKLSKLLGEVFAEQGLDPSLGLVVPSSHPERSQFQCNGAMAAARTAGRSPQEIAEEVKRRLDEFPQFERIMVAGPGFINLTLDDEFLAAEIELLLSDSRFGVEFTSDSKVTLMDYGGPNVAKAMHVGHLRATIIGDCLARMMEFWGHRVIRDPHFGDWGLQMGMLIVGLQETKPDILYFQEDASPSCPGEPLPTLEELSELYPKISARCQEDEELAEAARQATVKLQQGHPPYLALWTHLVSVSQSQHRRDFAALGVNFDVWYGEATVNDRIPGLIAQLRSRGFVQENDGAQVIPVAEPEDNREIPPLLLTKSDGGYLYATTDLATIDMRVRDMGVEQMLYVVDARQSDHFVQLFRAARLSGLCPPEVSMEHIPFGTMNGKDGKPFRTRSGGVVRLGDLIGMVSDAARKKLDEADLAQGYAPEEQEQIVRQVGIAALKFGDLINGRRSDYLFDLDRFASFEGKTGPYLQYGAVRIKAILRKTDEQGYDPGPILSPVNQEERELMLWLTRLPEIFSKSVNQRTPNGIAEYAYDLTVVFNRFYGACHILRQSDPVRRSSWITLVQATLALLSLLLGLLGIEVPDRM